MDARNKQQIRVPLAPEIKVEVVDLESSEESDEVPAAPRGRVLQRGGKGKATASAVVKAASKRKEAVVPVVKKQSAAASAQRTKALEKKKRAEMVAAQVKEHAAAISAAVEEEEDEDDEDSSDDDYVEEGESVDDSGDDSGSGYEEEEEELIPRVARENLPVHDEQLQPVEQPVVVDVEEAYGGDDDELAIVKVKKFQGCRMLAEVVRTEDSGVASRTRRRKVLKRQRLYSHFVYDRVSNGTFSDPINL
ncbi:unnamed protein product [Urochloa humidicola]